MRFLVDTNLPRALAAWLRSHGHAAEHVLDLSLAQADDDLIWRRAAETGAVIFSKDQDFADMVGRLPGPSVIWARTGNGTTAALIAYLAPLWPAIEQRLTAGDRLIEVR